MEKEKVLLWVPIVYVPVKMYHDELQLQEAINLITD